MEDLRAALILLGYKEINSTSEFIWAYKNKHSCIARYHPKFYDDELYSIARIGFSMNTPIQDKVIQYLEGLDDN